MIHSLLQTNSIYGKLKLTVYISKTKIDVVSKGRQSKSYLFFSTFLSLGFLLSFVNSGSNKVLSI